LDELVSQVDASSNSQQSQFDFEMSDDDDDGVHLKSIHELRQAGAVNRFDRDLDSLLEDIASETKSLRISGLMQLVRKLKEQAFKRHVLDHGKVGKLTSLIGANIDIISASIILLAL
jgi:Wings apart-like protein regulation of heterochromatin